MERTLILPCFLLVSKLLLLSCLMRNSSGLTLKLIHRNSLESPYYRPNLTQFRSRDHYLSSNYDMNPETIRGRIHNQDPLYMVKAGIGTFPNQEPSYKPYFLFIDTGSSLTWTQCEDCQYVHGHCFEQSVPPFPRRESRTFHGLRVAARPIHPLCDVNERRGVFCAYQVNYTDRSTTRGILGQDYFTFESDHGGSERVQLVFGCGFKNVNFDAFGPGNRITGMLGLGWGPHSLLNQLGDQTHGLFSYCLPPDSGGDHSTLLRFGAEVMHHRHPGFKMTPLIYHNGYETYFIALLGISINGQRLHIPPSVFQRIGEVGGTIIDSGTPISRLVADAYQPMRQTLVRIFSRIHGLHPMHDEHFDLCYTVPSRFGHRSLPTITFHFVGAGADLHASPEAGFDMFDDDEDNSRYFCLAILPSDGDRSVLGSLLQINNRFIYDTRGHQLHFAPEDCRHDARA